MDTSLDTQSYRPLDQRGAALGEPHELLDFYPGDERAHRRTAGAARTDQSPAPRSWLGHSMWPTISR